jgi:hypothetical protein
MSSQATKGDLSQEGLECRANLVRLIDAGGHARVCLVGVGAHLGSVKESKAVQAQGTSASFFLYTFSSTPAALGSSGGQVRTCLSVSCSFLPFACPTRPRSSAELFRSALHPQGKGAWDESGYLFHVEVFGADVHILAELLARLQLTHSHDEVCAALTRTSSVLGRLVTCGQ